MKTAAPIHFASSQLAKHALSARFSLPTRKSIGSCFPSLRTVFGVRPVFVYSNTSQLKNGEPPLDQVPVTAEIL